MTEPYDSTADTEAHIKRVQELLYEVCVNLNERSLNHDLSKFHPPEKEIFDKVTPRLKGLTYGSEEYNAQIKELGVALEHHYANNPHHPEHYSDGIMGMSLLDIVEMFADWKAATERHADGDLMRSIGINRERFSYGAVLESIFENTAHELRWK
jgi:hypothetical protein